MQLLHENGDAEDPHAGELADAAAVAPFREAARGVEIRVACGRLQLWGGGEDNFGAMAALLIVRQAIDDPQKLTGEDNYLAASSGFEQLRAN